MGELGVRDACPFRTPFICHFIPHFFTSQHNGAPFSPAAEANLGELDVREALVAKADYLAGIMDAAGAAAAYEVAEGKTAGAGPKMDLVFSMLRCAALYHAALCCCSPCYAFLGMRTARRGGPQ